MPRSPRTRPTRNVAVLHQRAARRARASRAGPRGPPADADSPSIASAGSPGHEVNQQEDQRRDAQQHRNGEREASNDVAQHGAAMIAASVGSQATPRESSSALSPSRLSAFVSPCRVSPARARRPSVARRAGPARRRPSAARRAVGRLRAAPPGSGSRRGMAQRLPHVPVRHAPARGRAPVFIHGDLQVDHVFVDGDDVTGVVDWSEASPGDALFDLAILTLGRGAPWRRPRRLRHRRRPRPDLRMVVVAIPAGGPLAVEHGFGPPEEMPESQCCDPGCEAARGVCYRRSATRPLLRVRENGRPSGPASRSSHRTRRGRRDVSCRERA